MKIKIMTFNIQHCKNYITKKIDYNSIINLIKKYNPDIVGLNEIYSFQLKKLCKYLDYNYYFGKSDNLILPYGNSILSKYDINNIKVIKIKDNNNFKYSEKRSILSCNVNINNNLYNIYVTHLGLKENEKINSINTLINNINIDNSIILGDFNINSDSKLLDKFNNFIDSTNKDLYTYPSTNPKYKLDYIFVSKNIKVIKSYVLEEVISDHRAIITEINV